MCKGHLATYNIQANNKQGSNFVQRIQRIHKDGGVLLFYIHINWPFEHLAWVYN